VNFDLLSRKLAHRLLQAFRTFTLTLGFYPFMLGTDVSTDTGQTDRQTGKTRNAAYYDARIIMPCLTANIDGFVVIVLYQLGLQFQYIDFFSKSDCCIIKLSAQYVYRN